MGARNSVTDLTPHTPHSGGMRETCCSSPSSICYWFLVSLAAWGLLALVGTYWRPLHASAAPTILFAASIGCVANWLRNRTFHCGLTAPLFFASGVVLLLADTGLIRIEPRFVWPFVAIGTGLSFVLEWRYARAGVDCKGDR